LKHADRDFGDLYFQDRDYLLRKGIFRGEVGQHED
jgi:hypothetical protein